MEENLKQLLLKDLCARLPYEVILLASNGKVVYQTDGNTAAELLVEEGWKPYLRPMSSMTEEERKYFRKLAFPYDFVDALNKHHFDYRNLIEKGLALEAPEKKKKK